MTGLYLIGIVVALGGARLLALVVVAMINVTRHRRAHRDHDNARRRYARDKNWMDWL